MKLSADKLVVITGACGAIASSFIQPLLNKGYKLLLADFNHEQINQFKSKYSSFIEANSVHLICANCCSEDGILAVLAYLDSFNMRPYAFMHLAYPRPTDWGTDLLQLSESSQLESFYSARSGNSLV